MWRICFVFIKRRYDFLEAKMRGENLEDKKKTKEIKQTKKENNQFFCYFITLFKKYFLYCKEASFSPTFTHA